MRRQPSPSKCRATQPRCFVRALLDTSHRCSRGNNGCSGRQIQAHVISVWRLLLPSSHSLLPSSLADLLLASLNACEQLSCTRDQPSHPLSGSLTRPDVIAAALWALLPHPQLVQSLVSTSWLRMYSRIAVSSRPTVDTSNRARNAARKILFVLSVRRPSESRSCLNETHHSERHTWAESKAHMHMVWHQVAFQHSTLLLLRQTGRLRPNARALIQYPPPALGMNDTWYLHSIRSGYTLQLSIRILLRSALAGSRKKFLGWTLIWMTCQPCTSLWLFLSLCFEDRTQQSGRFWRRLISLIFAGRTA